MDLMLFICLKWTKICGAFNLLHHVKSFMLISVMRFVYDNPKYPNPK